MLTQEIKDKVLLNTYGKNLTEDYRQNADKKPPIIGRETETRRCVEILSKKYKNNLVLVAPAGSGKTALVESLAAKLALDNVPSTLKGKELYEVDLQMLSAPNDDFGGPKKRLKDFIAEVESLHGDVILFIDEIHIIMGGDSEGAMDIANTLKPTLASADGISLIGATTPWEFHRYMEKDAAITRRFTRINMAVPTPEQAKSILRGRRRGLEIFYGVTISDEAVDQAVDLSQRYIPHRNLPDKAIDLLDQAAASVRVSIDAMPPELDLMQNQIALRQQELKSEKDAKNKRRIQREIDRLQPEFNRLYDLWKSQAETIKGFTKFRVALEDLRRKIEVEEARDVIDTAKVAQLENTFKVNEENLERAKTTYRSAPEVLIDDVVGEEAVRRTLGDMTGIPLSEIGADEKQRLRSLEDRLHEGVIGQNEAVRKTAYAIKRNRLGLGDPSQPIGSFLFLGTSGTGKALSDYELVPAIVDGKEGLVKHGDLKVGDFVFDRLGKPVRVTGVFPQGERQVYRLHLSDGRAVDASGDHLWTVATFSQRLTGTTKTLTTRDLVDSGLFYERPGNRRSLKYYLPANGAVEYSDSTFEIHPYVVGALIGDGCLTLPNLTLSSNDVHVVDRVANLLGSSGAVRESETNFNWKFLSADGAKRKYLSTKHIPDKLGLLGKKSYEKRIPEEYFYGSIEQRWSLIQGLFDTDGSVSRGSRTAVQLTTTSQELAQDVQRLLESLGHTSHITTVNRDDRVDGNGTLWRSRTQYLVIVRGTLEQKLNFFSLPRKRAVIEESIATDNRSRVKRFEWVGISEIEVLDEYAPMTCIMVDSDEHLYQLANGIVTHNTELVRQLAYVMFGSRDALKRIDMGEFKSEASISRLIGAPPGEDKTDTGGELTEWAKQKPYSIILFDEAEKAHPALFDMMLSLLDDGELTDSRGERVDFRNTIIVLTSNIGSAKIARGVDKRTGELDPRVRAEVDAMLRNPDRENGGKGFKPEFINRLDAIVTFVPLTREQIERIADIKLNSLRKRLLESRKIKLVFSEKIPMILQEDKGPVVDVSHWLASQYTHDDLNLGGRPLNRYITTYIEDALTDMLLDQDVPDGAHIYIRAKYPPGPPTTIGEDGLQRPVKPIIEIKQVPKNEYDMLIKLDPIYKPQRY